MTNFTPSTKQVLTTLKHLFFFFLVTSTISAQPYASLSKIDKLDKQEGFFNFWYAEDKDKIYLEVSALNEEFLYVHALTNGVGSNDIGLDRGQLGGTAVVKFQRAGGKLLLIQSNQDYRASTKNILEKKSVQQAFAQSVLFGFDILDENDGNFLVDFTAFVMQDAHGVAQRLKQNNEGVYSLDTTRSALALERTKAFPKNCEFEALLTFTGTPVGGNIQSVVPDASKLTVVQHHSFVKLPEEGFKMRKFDPRNAAYPMSYQDYSTPVFEPLTKRYITRHRLKKKNPTAPVSEAVEPIIYYLDPGTPEPIRTALLEGAGWWNQAFEAIGYKNAFQVKILPDDADPLDLRYNVIQWVHRSTRGWSYGASVTDPRTGEILKGHVSLGSLRIRQDFMIAQALMNAPFKSSDDNYQPMLEMALARIRQLSAHEVGHTLGFAHNFAASADGRTSVMDYPHPLLKFENNQLDFSNAYAVGIGDWDKVSVAYSYGDPLTGQSEAEYLESVVSEAKRDKFQFISDSDARPQGGAHVNAHLWDNAKSSAEELNRVLDLRTQAISNFSIHNIRTGDPYSVLEDVFVPLYFFHRYQTEAAVKSIGGLDYNYATKASGLLVTVPVEKRSQDLALSAVLRTLDASTLAIPEQLLDLFPPRAFGYNRTRESFKSNTGVSFDALGAASTASDMTLELLLNSERANRLIQQKAIQPSLLGLDELVDQLLENTLDKTHKSAYLNEVQNTINFNVLKHLMALSARKQSIPQVKAHVNSALLRLKDALGKQGSTISKEMAYQINLFLEKPEQFKVLPSPIIPDGSPIGSFQCLNN